MPTLQSVYQRKNYYLLIDYVHTLWKPFKSVFIHSAWEKSAGIPGQNNDQFTKFWVVRRDIFFNDE